jgi:hypothetical protein
MTRLLLEFSAALFAIGFLASALSTPIAETSREVEVQAGVQQHTEARRNAAVVREIITSAEAAPR